MENVLADYKKIVNSKIKKYEDHEVTGSGLQNSISEQKAITSNHVKSTKDITNKFLDLLSEELRTFDPDTADDEIDMQYVLKFLINFVADAINSKEVSLPQYKMGKRIKINQKQISSTKWNSTLCQMKSRTSSMR